METVHEESDRRFKKDTENHTLDIRHDDGVYRHIACSNNGSSIYRFDIVTYPGYLVVCGDMGEWIFTRVTDMFEFFRSPKGGINPGYWSEKCRAGEIKKFSEDKFKAIITEYVRQYYDEDFEEEEREAKYTEVMGTVQEEVFDLVEYGETSGHSAYQLINEFTHYFESDISDPFSGSQEPFQFVDTFEMSFDEYTFHFLWALRAIVWTINEYDKIKLEAECSRNRA